MLRSEKGVSAVEFALIAPLLFVLTFGIIEFSLLLFDKAVLTNASREGARAAIVFQGEDITPLGVEVIRPIVKDYANGYLINLGNSGVKNLSDTDITITWDGQTTPDDAESGDDVLVKVNFNYKFLVFQSVIKLIFGSGYEAGIPLEGRTVMRLE